MIKKKKENKEKVYHRRKEGIIVTKKTDKTVIVLVETLKKHDLYKKQYKTSRRYKVHDGKNEYKVGDKLIIEETRPLSKDKRWRALKKS